ncbi:hypothetical protein DFS34DRAFT_593551 [Phlyctochytrium arcticum]|nr:hypothetical protein DFS34DRAFT_593551 [Phlyctochytrium arcticum]
MPNFNWEHSDAYAISNVREAFARTSFLDSDGQLLREKLSDVVIEVYPDADATEVEVSKKLDVDTTAIARIPAHSAILANGSKYFHALFTNGMAQDKISEEDQVGRVTEKKLVKIKGYPLAAVQYFVGHIYRNKLDCMQQEILSLKDWEKVLQIADEFGVLSLFDDVSVFLLMTYLVKPGNISKDVIDLLQIGMSHHPSNVPHSIKTHIKCLHIQHTNFPKKQVKFSGKGVSRIAQNTILHYLQRSNWQTSSKNMHAEICFLKSLCSVNDGYMMGKLSVCDAREPRGNPGKGDGTAGLISMLGVVLAYRGEV